MQARRGSTTRRWGQRVAMVTTAVTALIGAAMPSASAHAPPRGPVELAGPFSYASDINDRGVVVGWQTPDPEAPFHAFRRSERGHVTDLGQGYALAVNDSGVAVGAHQGPDGTIQATRWGPDGRARDLGLSAEPGSSGDSWATDVNNRGLAVGYVATRLGYRAFAAAPGAEPVVLPHPAGVLEHQDVAVAVNERGDIAGYAVDRDTARLVPVLWRGRHHTPTLLPAPNTYHAVTGINERGTVVGTRIGTTGYQPVIWTGRDHHEVTVGPRDVNALGVAINDRGQVLSTDYSAATYRWDPHTGRTTTLRGLSPAATGRGMNNHGCAVGESSLPDSTIRATLLHPC